MDKTEREQFKQMLIRDVFKGDEKRYERYDQQSKREWVGFDQIMELENILPELEPHGKKLIKAILGFVPETFIILPHEGYIRGIINSFRMGMLTEQQLYEAAEESIITMRNAFVFHHNEPTYAQDVYQQYNDLPIYQKQAIRSRLTKLLGYEPELNASICAEISLAQAFYKDHLSYPEHLTSADFQVVQVIKYREVLLSKGKDAADKSYLPELARLNLQAFPPIA